MKDTRRRRLDSAVATIQPRYIPQTWQRDEVLDDLPVTPHISTTFPALDAITGCGGFPTGAITLLTGSNTSGKLTIAYKLLASAQRSLRGEVAYNVGLFDLSHGADPDFVARCGVDLDALLVARPALGPRTVQQLGDMIQRYQLRAVVVNSLAELAAHPVALQTLHKLLKRLRLLLTATDCTLVLLDEPSSLWQRWFNLDRARPVRWSAALHVEMQREQWLHMQGVLVGYRAQARLLRSHWVYGIRHAPIEIEFNGVVRSKERW
jgi:hypothetical protein